MLRVVDMISGVAEMIVERIMQMQKRIDYKRREEEWRRHERNTIASFMWTAAARHSLNYVRFFATKVGGSCSPLVKGIININYT